jgi:hypothetical protein
MVPASAVHAGYLNGFRVGRYPPPPTRRQATYQPPVGFVEVTPQNQDLLITPHLQLKQFLTKQPGGFPKYVVLDPRLLQKLELVFQLAQAAGYAKVGFHVMSGYRTPAYNQSPAKSSTAATSTAPPLTSSSTSTPRTASWTT